MKKNNLDRRTWQEIAGNTVSEYTERGDTIHLSVQYKGVEKPDVILSCLSYTIGQNDVDITDWVDDKPYYYVLDDTTGKPLEGEFKRGFDTWKEYIDVYLGPQVRSIILSGGRIFTYEEKF